MHGIAVAGGTFPADDLAPVHEPSRWRPRPFDWLQPKHSPVWQPFDTRPVRGRVRRRATSPSTTSDLDGPSDRRLRRRDAGTHRAAAGDDAAAAAEPAASAAGAPPPPPTLPAPSAVTVDPRSRRAWSSSSSSRGCAALAWPDDSPLVPQRRRTRRATAPGRGRSSCCRARARRLRRGAARCCAGRGGRRRAVVVARRGDPARPARGAAAALDRRVDVLGLRPHRRRARRRTRTATRPSDFPDDPALPVRRRGLARHDVGLRARLHARLGAARAGGGDVCGRGRVDLQGARGARGRARWPCSRLGSRARPGVRAGVRRLEPLLAMHFAGGGHNDAWMARSCSARSRAAGGTAAAGGRGVGARVLVKWVPLVLFPLRALEARDDAAARVGHWGSRSRRVVVVGLATLALRLRVARRVRPARGQRARDDELRACPHRLEQLGVPEDLAIVLFARRCSRVAYAWLARSALARPRAARARCRAAPAARRRTSRRGTRPGRCRSRRPRRTGSREASRSRSPRTCCRRRFPSDDTSTPSSSNTSTPAAGRRAARGSRSCVGARRDRGRGSRATSRRRRSTARRGARGKLRIRRRAERCAPSEFDALTTAPSGISSQRSRRDAVVFAHERRARPARSSPPGIAAQTGIAPRRKLRERASSHDEQRGATLRARAWRRREDRGGEERGDQRRPSSGSGSTSAFASTRAG